MDRETLQQFKDTLHRYVRERLVPLEEEVAATDRIPDPVRREMAEMGLFGMTVPEEFGGLGVNVSEEAELVMELCWASPVFRSVVGT
ncbi:MAG TPA: acyl-CoA dehydrogenase family protein, partial [Candidatus Sulfotelmatobacter sp.]|nr:acyl-CoA dehydrogenase family protein [Candidatus Sulfotelmatobacter sp.]